MTTPELTRRHVHQRLHDTYQAFISCTTGLSEADLDALAITSEWSALDILRHLSVWGELSARTLANWHGQQNWVLRSAVLDDFNAEMVAERADKHLNEVVDHILAAYGQYASTLLECSDEELQERTIAPWDEDLNRMELIYGILAHDLHHLREIQKFRSQSA
ncbi:MAG TPA: DinB family protein [Herpetosiphonaceae bacterium]